MKEVAGGLALCAGAVLLAFIDPGVLVPSHHTNATQLEEECMGTIVGGASCDDGCSDDDSGCGIPYSDICYHESGSMLKCPYHFKGELISHRACWYDPLHSPCPETICYCHWKSECVPLNFPDTFVCVWDMGEGDMVESGCNCFGPRR